jgi:hypothetical protein
MFSDIISLDKATGKVTKLGRSFAKYSQDDFHVMPPNVRHFLSLFVTIQNFFSFLSKMMFEMSLL